MNNFNVLSSTLDQAIRPALAILTIKESPQSIVQMLTIGLQESRLIYRRQLGNGPARGLWQFERGGGVVGVMNHHASEAKARLLCLARGVAFSSTAIHAALETDDVLAAGFARLLLLTDPRSLPAIDDTQGAWGYYVDNWRPGKPHPKSWPGFHAEAVEFVKGLK